MKQYWIILLVVLFSGCLGSRSVSESTSEKISTEVSESSKDSVKVESVNKAIDDKAELKVQESATGDRDFDEAVNKAVDRILSSINFTKTSGDNSYKMYYDLLERTMKMEAKIGETKTAETSVTSEEVTEKSFEEKTDEYLKKKVTTLPWWAWGLIALFLWPYIKPVVMMFLGPTNIVTSISNAIKPKTDGN